MMIPEEFRQDLAQSTDPFPLVLESDSGPQLEGLLSSIRKNKSWLENHLLRNSGAILFRGFDIKNAQDFAQVVESFGYPSMDYQQGAARRTRVFGPVYTANALDAETELGFHNEMSYLESYPDFVMFFCEIAPPKGGIVQGKLIYQKLANQHPEFVRDLENKGVNYYNLKTEQEWMDAYNTKDRAEAELKASKLAKKLVWLNDGSVKEVFRGSKNAIKTLDDGQKVWFNSIASANPIFKNFQYSEFGDGSEMPAEAVTAAKKLLQDEQFAIKWQVGDVAVVNNHRVLHAKHPSSPPRRILVSMLKNCE